MTRIARRDMLKAMAATGAGAALSSIGGIESVLAAPTASTPNPNPFGTPSQPKTPRIVVIAPSTKTLNVMGQEFKPNDTADTYAPGASVGSIQAVAGPAPGYYRASVHLPNGAVVSQVVFYVIANDASPTTVWFNGYDATTGGFAPLNSKSSSGLANPAIQALDMGIAPNVIDAVNTWYALYWFPGTQGATHQLYGVRITYMLQPGMYLFPNPRRIVSGDATPFTSGTTYGPFDGTLQFNGLTATAACLPVRRQPSVRSSPTRRAC